MMLIQGPHLQNHWSSLFVQHWVIHWRRITWRNSKFILPGLGPGNLDWENLGQHTWVGIFTNATEAWEPLVFRLLYGWTWNCGLGAMLRQQVGFKQLWLWEEKGKRAWEPSRIWIIGLLPAWLWPGSSPEEDSPVFWFVQLSNHSEVDSTQPKVRNLLKFWQRIETTYFCFLRSSNLFYCLNLFRQHDLFLCLCISNLSLFPLWRHLSLI